MPDGVPHIIFHVFARLPRQNHGIPSTRLTLVGPRATYFIADKKDRLLTCIARLKPGIRLPSDKLIWPALQNRSIALETLIGRDLSSVKKEMAQMALSNQPDQLVQRFQRLLGTLFNPSTGPSPLVEAALRLLDAPRTLQTVGTMAERLGVSSRHLRARFRTEVGLGPKRYAQIARVTAALCKLEAGYDWGYAQLALETGYYDQSHMIDECRLLLGESTDKFIRRTNRERILLSTSDFSNPQ